MVLRFGRRRQKKQQEPGKEPQAPTPEAPEAPPGHQQPEAGEANEPAQAAASKAPAVAGEPPLAESAEAAGDEETPAEATEKASAAPSSAEGPSRDSISLLNTLLRLHGAEDTASLTEAAAQFAQTYLDSTHLLVLLADKGGSFRLQALRSAATGTLVRQLNDMLGIDLADERPLPLQGRTAKIWLDDSASAHVVSLADVWGDPAGADTCQQAEKELGISQVSVLRLASPDGPLGIALFLSCGDPPDPAMLDAIGRHLTVALANLRSLEKARQFGSMDPIRWIPDRSEFTRQLSQEVNRARRYGHSVSLALLVVDNFDTLGLEYGWTVANRLLRSTSAALAECLPESDFLGSYRQNGFGVFLVQTSGEAASDTANRLREKAAAVRVLEGEEGPVPECVVATASYPEDAADASALLVAAQSRLLPKLRPSSLSA